MVKLPMGKWASKILIILYLVISCGTLYVFVSWYHYERPQIDEAIARKKFLEDGRKLKVTNTLKIKKLIINLPARTRKLRFLDLSTHIVPFDESDLRILEEQEYIIRDSIIEIAGKMQAEELNSISGKLLLEDRIIKKVNNIYKQDIIKELFFSRFLVQ
ncbi:MAG: flagellar basal body-associated FliL family protein [Deltaproteobacteria bacterium]|nr:MAG: flagellar basal body-associated FliL family protein [Deltaproteobacteria bacterium]